MARIPQAEIDRIQQEVSVERLVEGTGIELKKAGRDLMGKCPFHDDREASLVVTPAKNLWHCFGCQIGGGPIDWVMKRNGVSFRHAVELLREGICSLAAGSGLVKRAGQNGVGSRFCTPMNAPPPAPPATPTTAPTATSKKPAPAGKRER